MRSFKFSDVVLAVELIKLLRSIWKDQTPKDWSESTIVTVYTKDGRWILLSSHRGISLVSTAYRMPTGINSHRLSRTYQGRIRENQAGFLSDRICIDRITSMRWTLEPTHIMVVGNKLWTWLLVYITWILQTDIPPSTVHINVWYFFPATCAGCD